MYLEDVLGLIRSVVASMDEYVIVVEKDRDTEIRMRIYKPETVKYVLPILDGLSEVEVK